MIDQDAVIRRVVAKLERTGRRLPDLNRDETHFWIAFAFAELVAEGPVYPREVSP